jgi:beta-ribofuranosylaminobenzene 5'-phosphate synthase
MIGNRVSVRTPSRLHFGLLGWGPGSRRQFGGLGLMIQSPCIELEAEPAGHPQVEGPLAQRVQRIVAGLQERLAVVGVRLPPARIRVHRAPPEHVGLGVGTQISLAVASGLLRLAGQPDPGIEGLACLTGRGNRSGIGVHGFHQGGLVVDGGRKDGTGIPPMVARLAFPEDWSILVVQPPGAHGLHGADETRAFARLPAIAERVTERLCRIVLLDLLPAAVEHDLRAFGAALMELQGDVGAAFAPAQGGNYASPQGRAIVEDLVRSRFVGIGQSSWGPTIYAFSDRAPDEIADHANRLSRRFAIDPACFLITRADNQGACCRVFGVERGASPIEPA